MAAMTAAAEEDQLLAEEEEQDELLSEASKENIASAASLVLVCLGVAVFAPALEPGLTAVVAGVAGAASFGWDVYFRREIKRSGTETEPEMGAAIGFDD